MANLKWVWILFFHTGLLPLMSVESVLKCIISKMGYRTVVLGNISEVGKCVM